MMNQSPGDPLGENTYERSERNVNKMFQSLKLSEDGSEYTEESFSSNILFESFTDNDDEVFEDFQEPVLITREPRVRRVSDVIDSIGCSPSSPISRTSGNFEFTEKTVTETKEHSISIVRREDPSYINLQNPPRGRRATSSVTDSLMSPPITPSSDQGYCSAGLQTPPSTLVFRKKWFRYSASSCDAASPPKMDSQTDAQMMCAPSEEQQIPMEPTTTSPKGSPSGVTPLVYPSAPMPVHKGSFEYNMNHPKMGHAIIFNHEEFTMDNTPPRVGSKLDANRLSETLQALGFTVQIYHDLDSEKIKMRIQELASQDHSDSDCVLVAVLSHGMGTSYILSHDYPYPVDMLWAPFIPDRCPTLAGKPKIFLIQACRGDKLDGGVVLVKRTQVDSDSGAHTYKIPAMADFLIAYSTAEGFYSWRNPQKGTWFIQSLCDVLETKAYNHSLQSLFTMVSQRVALDHESFSDLYPWQHEQKQVPQIVSTLIRKVYFKKKL